MENLKLKYNKESRSIFVAGESKKFSKISLFQKDVTNDFVGVVLEVYETPTEIHVAGTNDVYRVTIKKLEYGFIRRMINSLKKI